MRFARRNDFAPRVEMTPMIDVIFLLLTFFIYSLVMMVQAQVLPVELAPLRTGDAAEPGEIAAITIDAAGAIYLNREPVGDDDLDARLAEFAAADRPPTLFLAMEVDADSPGSAEGGPATAIDRGPLLIALIERVRAAGLTNFNIVGAPEPDSP